MLNNINPKIWGESFWKMMHYVTFAYPNNPTVDDKNNVRIFFTNIVNVLPCENCRVHYTLNLKNYPLTDEVLSSKNNLVKWLIDVHNEVNKRTGKPELTLEEASEIYLSTKNDENQVFISNKTMIILFMIFIIILLIIYMKTS